MSGGQSCILGHWKQRGDRGGTGTLAKMKLLKSLRGAASLRAHVRRQPHTETQTVQVSLLICTGLCSEMHDPSSIHIHPSESWEYLSDAGPGCTLIHLPQGKDAGALPSVHKGPCKALERHFQQSHGVTEQGQWL